MINISNILVKELRKCTGAGVLDCKKALIKNKGKVDLAIDYIRRLGLAKALKKESCIVTEGAIFINISKNNKYGVIIELNCETDFVSNNNNFINFGNNIAVTAIKKKITNIKELNIMFENERIELISKIGENINIRRFNFLQGDIISSYLHGTSIGVLVSSTKNNDKLLLKHIAMHIAASKPKYIDINHIPENILSHEYQIQMDIAIKSKKSHDIAKKIVQGRMNKFISEISLMDQYFIMNMDKKIRELLCENNVKINDFIYFKVGEFIEIN